MSFPPVIQISPRMAEVLYEQDDLGPSIERLLEEYEATQVKITTTDEVRNKTGEYAPGRHKVVPLIDLVQEVELWLFKHGVTNPTLVFSALDRTRDYIGGEEVLLSAGGLVLRIVSLPREQ